LDYSDFNCNVRKRVLRDRADELAVRRKLSPWIKDI
jgi:hypothetical protein